MQPKNYLTASWRDYISSRRLSRKRELLTERFISSAATLQGIRISIRQLPSLQLSRLTTTRSKPL